MDNEELLRLERLKNVELVGEIEEARLRERSLLATIEETANERERAGKRLAEINLEAERQKKAAEQAYYIALKSAKNFSEAVKEGLVQADCGEKKRIIDLLTDLLSDLTPENASLKLQKVKEKVFTEEEKKDSDGEFEFDLDAAINPKEELSLEQLCRELGVYNG